MQCSAWELPQTALNTTQKRTHDPFTHECIPKSSFKIFAHFFLHTHNPDRVGTHKKNSKKRWLKFFFGFVKIGNSVVATSEQSPLVTFSVFKKKSENGRGTHAHTKQRDTKPFV